jgi:hypothetical protein
MSLFDLASLAALVSVVAVQSQLIYVAAILAVLVVVAFAGFRLTRPKVDDMGVQGREPGYPGAPIFQDHLEVIIRVNDWISEGNRGEDLPPRDVFLKMPSRTIDTLIRQLGYFGYSGAIRKLYLRNEARINRVLHHTHPNSEERDTAMNVILADVFIDLAKQANIKIPTREAAG